MTAAAKVHAAALGKSAGVPLTLLPEARRIVVGRDAGLELGILGVEARSALDELAFGLRVLRIRQAAFDRTDGLASFVIVETDALRAQLGVDHVDLVALADGFIRALWLAGAAVDAVVGDVRRHVFSNTIRARFL